MKHEFYLARTTGAHQFLRYEVDNDAILDSVVVDDDIIQYISDSLAWIPSRNPALPGNPQGLGLHYHGVTLFDCTSADSLAGILTAWRDLFKHAPNPVKLTGSFQTMEQSAANGDYEQLIVDKDRLINTFDHFISMAEILKHGDVYLYHCGL